MAFCPHAHCLYNAPSMKIGFAGLGRMGGRMAQRLIDASLDVSAYDAVPGKAAALSGARPVQSPGELAECEAVLTSVTDGPAVMSLLAGPGGLLAKAKPGLLLVELTTIGVADSERVAAACEPAGVRYVRSPLLGTLDSVATGKLIALVSGPPEAAAAARPLLAHLCAEQRYLGPAEEGRVMKQLINVLLAAGLTAVSEALTLGQKAGLPLSDRFRASFHHPAPSKNSRTASSAVMPCRA
jgi:3-hydroxyisobutyrate dehydrogenase-like beta-hydroxyacid dehydrogenase